MQGMDGNGGCWDYHEWLWICPSFPTFSTSKFMVVNEDFINKELELKFLGP